MTTMTTTKSTKRAPRKSAPATGITRPAWKERGIVINCGGRRVVCNSLKQAAQAWRNYIEESTGRWGVGLGASDLRRGDGDVTRNCKYLGEFSYNGRFWRGGYEKVRAQRAAQH